MLFRSWEPTARIEPTPECLQRARADLAEYGFVLVDHPWDGPHLYQINYPASAQPIVCGFHNAMNIEDVERFAVNLAPRRSDWHRSFAKPADWDA